MAARDLAAIVKAKDEASAEFKRIGDEVEKFSGGFLKIPAAAGAAVVGIGAVLLIAKEAAEKALALGEAFDSAMDGIRVATGATDEEFAQFGRHLDEVLRAIPTDMEPAGQALAQLSVRLGATGEGLEHLAEQELELARLTKTSLSENIRENARLMQSWRVDTDDQSATLDKLFVAGQQTGASVAGLSTSVTGAGAALRGLGFSLDESIALLAQMDKQGANAELASRGLKAALSALSQAGLDAPTAFREYIRAIHDATDETEALALATALFGSRSAAELSDAIRRGVFDVDTLTAKMQGAGGAILDTSKKTADAAEAWKIASNDMAVAFRPVGEAALSGATAVAGAIAFMVRAVTDDGRTIRKELADIALAHALAEAAQRGEAPIGPQQSKTLRSPGEDFKLSRNFSDEFLKAGAEAAAKSAGSKMAELMSGQFRAELARGLHSLDLERQLGAEGGRAAEAFMKPFSDEKWGENVGKSVDEMIAAMTREGVPGAAQLGQDIRDAITEAIASGTDAGAQAVLARIGVAGSALTFKRGEGDRKREADDAIREAQRIADEWKRTMPITGENFVTELQRGAAAASLGAGRGIFEGLTKAIADGGETNIAAVGKLAADMAQKMRDELGPEQGEQWATELINRVNQAISDRTPGSIAAVGEWVKAFDVESQLKVAGDRAAIAINEAIQQAEQSIAQAQQNAQDRIDRIRADAKLAADRELERGGLQKTIDTGMDAFRETQGGTQRAAQNAREESDIALRRAREDSDLEAKRLADKDKSAQEQVKLQQQIDDSRFRGDTLGTLRAMKALEDRKKAITQGADDELKALTLRRQREDEDFTLRRARQVEDVANAKTDAAELQAERDRLFESSGMKGFIDRIRNEDLDRAINDVLKGRDDTIDSINQHLDDLREKTTADMDILRDKLLGVRDVADTLFDGAIAHAERLAALFGPGGPGPAAGAGEDASGGKTLTIGEINVTTTGDGQAIANGIVAAEEAVMAQ